MQIPKYGKNQKDSKFFGDFSLISPDPSEFGAGFRKRGGE